MIDALPYHKAVSAYLQEYEPDLWAWFQNESESVETQERIKLSILKNAVRLDVENNQTLYELAHQACSRLEVDRPVTLYQVQGSFLAPNAALVYTPDEISILLQGALIDLLGSPEILALFGHEISHYKFFAIENGRYLIADKAITWCANEIGCAQSLLETQRRWKLSTELYADRGASKVAGEIEAVISLLIRLTTGTKGGSAHAYLEQAQEILEKSDEASEGKTHPENYIRAVALDKWSKQDEDGVRTLVCGNLVLQQLDLLDQVRLQNLTFGLVERLTKLFGGEHCRNLAARYRSEVHVPSEDVQLDFLKDDPLHGLDHAATEYLAYVIMDFVTIDADRWEENLQKSFEVVDKLKLGNVFEPLLIKEAALTKRAIGGYRKGHAASNAGAAT